MNNMEIRKYILRSLRYILRMVVLLGIVFALMAVLGLLDTGGSTLLRALFLSRNGLLLLGILVILAGMYPRLSFAEVMVRGNIHTDRTKIKEVMAAYGYLPTVEEEDRMVFRAATLSRKILAQWDDAVTVTGQGDRLYIEGMKKDIFRIHSRLAGALGYHE